MTHAEAFKILLAYSKRIDIDSSSSVGCASYPNTVKVSFTISVWLKYGSRYETELKQYDGESLEVAVARAQADLNSPETTTVDQLEASLATITEGKSTEWHEY